jgi:hypothetical protein
VLMFLLWLLSMMQQNCHRHEMNQSPTLEAKPLQIACEGQTAQKVEEEINRSLSFIFHILAYVSLRRLCRLMWLIFDDM